mmetsp:Transcript_74803/g.150459  ORF Transcript_74803/g.150459 Transcript_74803/m.150459 type:complete len:226 (-) Transcript_74803:13-690(-)
MNSRRRGFRRASLTSVEALSRSNSASGSLYPFSSASTSISSSGRGLLCPRGREVDNSVLTVFSLAADEVQACLCFLQHSKLQYGDRHRGHRYFLAKSDEPQMMQPELFRGVEGDTSLAAELAAGSCALISSGRACTDEDCSSSAEELAAGPCALLSSGRACTSIEGSSSSSAVELAAGSCALIPSARACTSDTGSLSSAVKLVVGSCALLSLGRACTSDEVCSMQ